jgi:hypothetical protein
MMKKQKAAGAAAFQVRYCKAVRRQAWFRGSPWRRRLPSPARTQDDAPTVESGCNRTDTKLASHGLMTGVPGAILPNGWWGLSPLDQAHVLITFNWRFTMYIRTTLTAAMTALVLLTAAGCAVTRGQETVGAYIDDATITTQVKARMLDNPSVAGTSISVETLNGTVLLSGFAKSLTEKNTAGSIARDVNGVRSVRNEIVVRP